MSVALSVVVAAAARVGAPFIKSLLRDKVGGVPGEIGEAIINAVAERAEVDPKDIPDLEDDVLENAVRAVEAEGPAILDAYLAMQKEANALQLAEMSKDSAFGWMWRPAGMWLMLGALFWYIILVPVLNALLPTPLEMAVGFEDFVAVFITFTGLYMGGHTVKAAFRK